ncbi:signal recognition particle subunit SRP72-like isoform X2 [Gordionus sp. m RMFG-2023]|uniref:signal recognition particle subunit SRP72-like isoform X2 n=1 Tax=Gordionus sp. m RMFG-2023 TaxID=3053472 RepID=UPI0031FCD74E
MLLIKLYKLDDFKSCCSLYLDIIKSTQDEFDEERICNLLASLSYSSDQTILKNFEDDESDRVNYEIYFNLASLYLVKKDTTKAKDYLVKAEKVCRKFYSSHDQQDELLKEIKNIEAQFGYIHQLNGENEKALKIYDSMVLSQDSSSPLPIIITNNKYIIRQDNVNEYKKSIKKIADSKISQKLNNQQMKELYLDHVIFCLQNNQLDLCRNLVKNYEQRFPDEKYQAMIINVALLCKDKKMEKALQITRDFISENVDKPDDNSSLMCAYLTEAQLYMDIDDYMNAAKTLEKIPDMYRYPQIVQFLIYLYQKAGKNNANELNEDIIGDLYLNAITWNSANKQDGKKSFVPYYLQELINYTTANKATLSQSFNEKVAALLEDQYRTDPENLIVQGMLLKLYDKYDTDKAKKLAHDILKDRGGDDTNSLTILDEQAIDAISKAMSAHKKSKRKRLASDSQQKPLVTAGPTSVTEPAIDVLVTSANQPTSSLSKKNKNCALKHKLKCKAKRIAALKAKNVFGTTGADPDRWLPRHLRTASSLTSTHHYYKKKKGIKGGAAKNAELGRGTQGAAPTATDGKPSTENQATNSQPSTSTNVNIPSNPVLKANANKNIIKKKKKKGNKW